MFASPKYLLDMRTECTYLWYMLNNTPLTGCCDSPPWACRCETEGVPRHVEDPDFDAMWDEQFEAHLAEQRAKGERKEAWRVWLEAHPYGFAKGGV